MSATPNAARDEILARVRKALSAEGTPHPGTDAPTGPTGDPHATRSPLTRHDVLDLLVERIEDYRATVVRCTTAELAQTVAGGLEGCESVVVPAGFDAAYLDAAHLDAATVRRVAEADVTDVHDIEGVDAVVSTAAVAIAETGTIVLDHGPGQGRRGLTLLPDRHVCVVRADQVVAGVPEAFAVLRPSVDARRPLTWVSGPSATSDIELDRVEGVHGPRMLHVVLVAEAT
ncbi:lactate utilization protein C [Terrabacter sp. GCM10028922]|uniref:LutC/YkgG family protein n=1 Tax=Terrabacter sp. GCM10028922 TaxID=3273428 RepID=UPI00360772E0